MLTRTLAAMAIAAAAMGVVTAPAAAGHWGDRGDGRRGGYHQSTPDRSPGGPAARDKGTSFSGFGLDKPLCSLCWKLTA